MNLTYPVPIWHFWVEDGFPWRAIPVVTICILVDLGRSKMLLMEEIPTTTWDVKNHVNDGINYLSIKWLAGFLPSTVYLIEEYIVGFRTCFGDQIPTVDETTLMNEAMKFPPQKKPASLVYPDSYGIISFTNSQYISICLGVIHVASTPSWSTLANVSNCPPPKHAGVPFFLPFSAIQFSWSAGVTTVPWWPRNVAKLMARVWWPSGPSGWSGVSLRGKIWEVDNTLPKNKARMEQQKQEGFLRQWFFPL